VGRIEVGLLRFAPVILSALLLSAYFLRAGNHGLVAAGRVFHAPCAVTASDGVRTISLNIDLPG